MKRALAAVAVAGFAIRVAYGLIAHVPSGFGDDVWFHAVANGLVHGRGFSDPFHTLTSDGSIEFFRAGGHTIATAFHPPLFPFVLAPLSAVGLDTYTAHQIAGCAIGSVGVYVIGLVARRLGGDRAALAAAAIAAVFIPMISREALLQSESLYGLLIALILLAALRLMDAPSSWRRGLELGALIGLAALTRGEALLLLVPPLLLLFARRMPARTAVITIGTAVLICLPWAIRNTLEFDQLTLITTGDGSVIAGSNLPRTYHGPDLGGFDIVGLYRTPAGRDVDPNEAVQSDRWRREGIDFARDHASRLPVVLAARALRTWDLFPFDPRARADLGSDQYHHIRALDYPGQLMLLAVVILAVLGGVAVRRHRGPLWLFVVPIVLVTLVSLAGHGDPRYRHAADVALVVLAGVGAARFLGGSAPPGMKERP